MDLLAAYGSGSSSDEDSEDKKGEVVGTRQPKSKQPQVTEKRHRLPPPVDFLKAFPTKDQPKPKKRKRGGPSQWVRNFAHVDGNWPSHIYISVPQDPSLERLARYAIERTKREFARRCNENNVAKGGRDMLDDDFPQIVRMGDAAEDGEGGSDREEKDSYDLGTNRKETLEDLHLTLSRTFVLRHSQIALFVDQLRDTIGRIPRFRVSLFGERVFVNDEATRSFVSLLVQHGRNEAVSLIRCVDAVLSEVEQPPYYDDPIPHVSVASLLGDVRPFNPHAPLLTAGGGLDDKNAREASSMVGEASDGGGENGRGAGLAGCSRGGAGSGDIDRQAQPFNSSSKDDGETRQHPAGKWLDVTEVCCDIGNKHFVLPLL